MKSRFYPLKKTLGVKALTGKRLTLPHKRPECFHKLLSVKCSNHHIKFLIHTVWSAVLESHASLVPFLSDEVDVVVPSPSLLFPSSLCNLQRM